MRNFGHDHRNSSSSAPGVRADEMARSAMLSKLAAGTSFVKQFEDSGAPAAAHSVGKAHARPDAPPRGTAAAMSRLLGAVAHGFAAYGEAMYPGFADPREHSDRDELERNSRPHYPTEDAHRNGVYPLYTDHPWLVEIAVPSANAQAAAPRWSTRIASPVLRLWSMMRREWEVRRAIAELQALNDYMLKDMGISRCQIENAVKRGDRRGW